MKILFKLIILSIIFISQATAALPHNQQVSFNKLPVGSSGIMVVSFKDRVVVFYGTIDKDLFDNNYFQCFDTEEDVWRYIYCNEYEVVDFYLEGERM